MDFHNKRITVVGLGKSGQAAARLCHQRGARVFLSEYSPIDKIDAGFRCWISEQKIDAEFGGHSRERIEQSDLLVVSPGVPADADPIRWAKAAGILVIGEVELGFRVCPCPVIAVTGSNGKTTVTTLIGRVLEAAGRKVFVGGNIGRPLCDHVEGLTPDHWAILEISSFQLETIQQFRPQVAVLLNISQNHLDRHADMQEYIQAKARIFENQTSGDFAVLNARETVCCDLAGTVKSQVAWFNEEKAGTIVDSNPNFSAVRAVAGVLGISRECCDQVFQSFKGIEHRLESVAVVNGVEYINDSKSTTTEATRWALLRLEAPIVWICGGRDKNLDFSVLREMVTQKVRTIIAIGEARAKIQGVFDGYAPVECFTDFKLAIEAAARVAVKGDRVLLSPMCASFDMFDNFEHRGREFKRLVKQLLPGGSV
ncbi:MAG TPA: UDP-N-acetylmuramoyl-L-alanine--D-glutamate ligase [Candidatus Bathyarchaeia archaeon]|nr:UDP-N-acetylmuramoyl-L-alanine--D-glutamate ligase [Candidatus Bathyarchaeia archaeon]